MRAALGFFLVAAASAQTARIDGRLINGVTGEAVAGASVHLRIAVYRGGQYNVVSDGDGLFAFERLPGGTYILSADRAGFLTANYGVRFLPAGEPIRLSAGESRSLEFTLMPRASISGRVLGPGAEPLPGARVEAWKWAWLAQSGQRTLRVVDRTMSDDHGNFHLNRLETGSYFVTATVDPEDPEPQPRLFRRRPVQESFPITFYPNAPSVAEAWLVQAIAGRDTSAVNLKLDRLRLFRVGGKIVNFYSGHSIKPVTLELIPQDPSALALPTSIHSVTAMDGVFEFSGVRPGRYSIIARDNSPSEHLVSRLEVSVTEKDQDNLRLELRPGAEVTCLVHTDRPIADDHYLVQIPVGQEFKVAVILRSAEGSRLGASVATEDMHERTLRLRNVPPGKYWVDLANVPQGFYVKSIRFGEQDGTAAPLLVRESDKSPLDVTLSDKTATLSGVVETARGKPVGISQVVLAPASPNLAAVSRLVKGAVSNASGAFQFTNVTPGDYFLLAFEDTQPGEAEDPEFRAAFQGDAVEVSISPASSKTATLYVIPRQ
jgi:hypothetical protein